MIDTSSDTAPSPALFTARISIDQEVPLVRPPMVTADDVIAGEYAVHELPLSVEDV